VTTTPTKSLISTIDAAARIGVAPITMRLWRWRKNPHQPPYVKVGSRGVKYDPDALDKWRAANTHQPGSKATRKDHGPGRQRRPGPR